VKEKEKNPERIVPIAGNRVGTRFYSCKKPQGFEEPLIPGSTGRSTR